MIINVSNDSLKGLFKCLEKHIECTEKMKTFNYTPNKMSENIDTRVGAWLDACELLLDYIEKKQIVIEMPTKITVKNSPYLSI